MSGSKSRVARRGRPITARRRRARNGLFLFDAAVQSRESLIVLLQRLTEPTQYIAPFSTSTSSQRHHREVEEGDVRHPTLRWFCVLFSLPAGLWARVPFGMHGATQPRGRRTTHKTTGDGVYCRVLHAKSGRPRSDGAVIAAV